MTEKIKVPQYVADAIEKMKEVHSNFGVIQRMEKGTFSPDNLIEAVGALRNWTHEEEGDGCNADRLLAALVNGYEIEPKYKEGDWVHVSWSNGGASVHKVLKIGVRSIGGDLDGIAIDAGGNPKPPLRIVRHATAEEIAHEKEQRKWAEIKPGDVVISQISGAIAIYEGISPCYREVRVKKHNGAHQFWWNENNIELYAKKVGDE